MKVTKKWLSWAVAAVLVVPNGTIVAQAATAQMVATSALTVTGTVTSSDNQPISGATVTVYDSDGWFLKSAVTDSAGSYSIPVNSGGSYDVCVAKENYDPVFSPSNVLASDTAPTVQDFTMTQNFDAQFRDGNVRDFNYVGVPDVKVELYDQTAQQLVEVTGSDETGHFNLEMPPQGHNYTIDYYKGYIVQIYDQNDTIDQLNPLIGTEMGSDSDVFSGNLGLGESVQFERQAGLDYNSTIYQVGTDSSGNYRVAVPYGDYEVYTESQGGTIGPKQKTHVSGGQTHTLNYDDLHSTGPLPPAFAYDVKVNDEAGQALTDATVRLVNEAHGQDFQTLTSANTDGAYEVDPSPNISYQLTASKTFGDSTIMENYQHLQLTSTDTPKSFLLSNQAGEQAGLLTGKVNGLLAQTADIIVTDAHDANHFWTVQTDTDGNYTIALPAGTYSVKGTDYNNPITQLNDVTITNTATKTLDLVDPAGMPTGPVVPFAYIGQITDENAQPLENVSVDLHMANSARSKGQATSDADGTYSLTVPYTGNFGLTATRTFDGTGYSVSESFTSLALSKSQAPEPFQLTDQKGTTTGMIKGYVNNESDHLPNGVVTFTNWNDPNQIWQVACDNNGYFQIGLPAGIYDIDAYYSNHMEVSYEHQVVVKANEEQPQRIYRAWPFYNEGISGIVEYPPPGYTNPPARTHSGGGTITPTPGGGGATPAPAPTNTDPVTVTTAQNATGQTVVNAIVNSANLTSELDALKTDTDKTLQLQVAGQGDIVEAQLDASVFSKVASTVTGGQLKITSDVGEWTISADQVTTALKQLGFADTAQVTITLSKTDTATEQRVNEAITANGGQDLTTPVEFKMEVASADGTDKQEISTFGSYAAHTLTVPSANVGDLTYDHLVAVMIDPQTGNQTPIPATFTKDSAGNVQATAWRKGNSLYTIVKNDKTFTDVTADNYAQHMIETLANKAILTGVGDGTFHPHDDVTRAQFAVMLTKALGLLPDATEQHFDDVSGNAWYAGAVGAAYKAGLIHGYEDGNFHPNDKITREQMLVMIAGGMVSSGLYQDQLAATDRVTLLAGYQDKDSIHDWSREAVSIAIQAKISVGVAPQTFAPQAKADRAQAASFLYRMLKTLGWMTE